jgi:hypothetical protein
MPASSLSASGRVFVERARAYMPMAEMILRGLGAVVALS